MKLVSVKNRVRGRQVYDQVRNLVDVQVWDQVCNQAQWRVRGLFLDHVYDQVWDQIREQL